MRVIPIAVTGMSMLGLVAAQGSCAPSGAHVQSGTQECHCNTDGSITCSSFQVCGVGNTNANVDANSAYSATVQCRNKGGQIVDVKSQDINISKPVNNIRAKNGCLTIPEITTGPAPTATQFENQATCPNKNWSKQLLGGTIVDNYSYAVTFVGFSCSYVTFSGTCNA